MIVSLVSYTKVTAESFGNIFTDLSSPLVFTFLMKNIKMMKFKVNYMMYKKGEVKGKEG